MDAATIRVNGQYQDMAWSAFGQPASLVRAIKLAIDLGLMPKWTNK